MKRILSFIIIIFLFSFVSSAFAQEKNKENKNEDPVPEWTPEADRKTRFGEDKSEKDVFDQKPLPKSTNFFVYGLSVGTPGSINVNVGYYFKDLVVRASGGHWGAHWWGWQADIGVSFWKTPFLAHSISAVIGQFQVDPFAPELGKGGQTQYKTGSDFPGYQHRDITYEDAIIRSYIAEQNPNLATVLEYQSRDNQKVTLNQRYIGLTYDLYMGNFFLQLGGGIGSGDYKNPQLLIQIGYLFDTRSSQ
ncbi:hypothetical protein [Leptospira sarikeiensis]|uniref:DUF3575 domain-containing protein n=1 Tax=Leptospira sarikeiensis TaxID=2484943 RepID=A0A4R9KAH2_9LEPT|nr:hypothetical protein [Leptospira sarikeiensis]TGL62971.1 hypothetical protein EHQ64_07295 [Leptospira sarikeiensis]